MVQELDDEGDEAAGNVEPNVDEGHEEPLISLCAMGALQESEHQTMRMKGKHKKRTLHILVDIGSTFNVLNSSVAKGLGCCLKAIAPLKITVANGNVVVCTWKCENF